MASASKAKGKDPASVLKNLESAIKDALPLSGMIVSFDGLQRERDSLKQQLETANQAIREGKTELKGKAKELSNILQVFEERYAAWSKKETALEFELDKLRQQAEKTKQESQQDLEKTKQETQQELAATKQHYEAIQNQLQSQLDKQKTMGKGLRARLQEAERDFQSLKIDVGLDDHQPTLLGQVKHVENSLQSLCARFFSVPAILSCEREPHLIQHPGGFTRSSSLTSWIAASVYPRPVIAQAYIAQQLSIEVFSQLYIPSPISRWRMGDAIDRSENIQPQQKAVLRNLLMAAFPVEDKRLQEDALETVSSTLLRDLKEMLSPQAVSDFQNELNEFLQLAIRVWNLVRRSSRWITATCSSAVFPKMWRAYDSKSIEPIPSGRGHTALILFPHLYCEGDEQPLYCGLRWAGYSHPQGVESSGHHPMSYDHQQAYIGGGNRAANAEEWQLSASDPGRERSRKGRAGGGAAEQSSDLKRCLSRKGPLSGMLTDSEPVGGSG